MMSKDVNYEEDGEWYERTSSRLKDALGNDITSTNPLSVTSSNALVTELFDAIVITYPTTSTEVYTYKLGGLAGTTVATITLTYTDSTKETLTSVERS